MRRYLILLSISLLPIIIFGQQLPTVVPPSPQAQQMIKYIDYPVNYSSGLPIIDVPIYTIQSKELTLPISLSYHSSGFKPNEKDALVGQGWTLNAGGRISRQIKNTPDEFCITNLIKEESAFPFHCYGALNGCLYDRSDPETDYLASAARAYGSDMDFDTEYDIFYYDCPNSASGKFIFKRNDQNKLLPITLPYRPIVIIPGDSLVGQSIEHFKSKLDIRYFDIIDAKGVLYRYGRSLKSGVNVTEKSKNLDFSNRVTSEGKTSWLLTEMISADKSDTISFEYVQPLSEIKEVHIPYYKTSTKTNYINTPHPDEVILDQNGMHCTQTNTYTQTQLSCIKFKNGEVRILYANDYYNDQYSKLSIAGVRVYDKNSTAIKKIDFKQSPYSTTSPYWYKLNGVVFSDRNSGITEVFSFDYYELPNTAGITKPLPTVHMNSGTLNQEYFYTFDSNAIDYWGFYNGANTNTSLLAAATSTDCYGTHPFLRELYGDANREIDADYTKVGVLKKITYPTGGSTTYEYEGNKSGYSIPVGGLRVKKITHQNTDLTTTSHSYTYGAAISVLGNPESMLKYLDNYKSFSTCTNLSQNYTWNVSITSTNSSSPQIDYNLNAQPITYCEVTEKLGDENQNTGSIFRAYDTKSLMKDEDMKYDVFPTFSERNQAPWFGGLMQYGDQCNGNPFFGSRIFYQKNFRFGDLQEKEISVFDANGKIKKRTINSYNQIKKDSLMGLYAKRMSTTLGKYIYTNNQFWKRNYNIEQLSQQLDSSVTTEYLGGNSTPLTSKTTYAYNVNNLPITQLTAKSDGTNIKSTFTYPNEESCPSCPSLVTANIITPIITNKDYLVDGIGTNDKLLKTTHTNFNGFGKPLVVQTATYNNPLENRINYSYNSSTQNIQSLNKANDVITTYLWSYNNMYPIAQIVNANYTDVEAVLGGAQNIINFSNKTVPTHDEITAFLAPLSTDPRTNSAQISSYTYSPLIGMTTATDPRGVTTNYTYDTFNRLYLARNDDKNIISRYQYASQNSSNNGQGGYPRLTATVSTDVTIYRPGNNGMATLSPVSGGSGSYTYNWYLKNNDNIVLSSQLNTTSNTFSYIYSQGGILKIICTVTDNQTGQSLMLSVTCYSIPTSSISIDASYYMLNGTGNATVTAGNGSGNYSYSWFLNETASPITTNTFAFTVSTVGKQVIRCTVTDNITGQTITNIKTAPSYDVPTATFSFGASYYMLNSMGSTTATAGGGSGNYSYSWSLNGTTSSVTTNTFSFTCSTVGIQTVKCTVTDNITGRTATYTKTVTCYAVPTATVSFGASYYMVNGTGSATVTTGTGSGNYSYKWFVNDNASSITTSTFNFTASSPGPKRIKCIVTDNITGQTITDIKVVPFYEVPTIVISFGASYYMLNGTGAATATAGSGSGNYSYSWFLNGTASSSTTSTFSFTNSTVGIQTIKCIVTDNVTGQTATDTKTVVCYSVPTTTVTIGAPYYMLNGTGSATVTTGGGSGNYSYSWSLNGIASSVTTNTFSFTCSTVGTQTIKCTVTDNITGQTANDTKTVICYTTPTAAVTIGASYYMLNGAGSATVTPGSGSGNYSYSWSLNGIASSVTTSTFSFTASTVGTQTIKCIVTDNITGQTANDTKTVICYTTPTATVAIGASYYILNGAGSATVTPGSGSGNYSYSWSLNGTVSSVTTNTFSFTASTVGTQTIKCTVTDNVTGQTATDTKTVVCYAVPTATVTIGASYYMLNGTGTATVTPGSGSGNYSYSWSLNGTASSITTNTFSFTSSTTGTQIIKCTVTDNITGQTTTDTKTVPYYATPNATVTAGTSIYISGETGSATLSSVSGGSGSYTYSWYLKNISGTVLANNLSTTSNSFSYTCSETGNLTIQCVITDNITGVVTTVSTGINCIATSASGVFKFRDGYRKIAPYMSRDGRVVTFVLAFAPISFPISVGSNLYIADAPDGFKPSVTRTVTYVTGGRTWNITLNPDGSVYCRIVNGSTLPVGSSVSLGTLTYNI